MLYSATVEPAPLLSGTNADLLGETIEAASGLAALSEPISKGRDALRSVAGRGGIYKGVSARR